MKEFKLGDILNKVFNEICELTNTPKDGRDGEQIALKLDKVMSWKKEFIKLLKEDIYHQLVEWEMYEKRFPHKETKWNRVNSRVQIVIDKLAGAN